MSTTYYALFHCLARSCADTLVGKTRASRNTPAWRQANRALEHGYARSRCLDQPSMKRFPREVRNFADQFVDIQGKRAEADYDPEAPQGRWSKADVAEDIDTSEDAIERFETAPLRDRRAFAVFVLLRHRKR